MQLRTNDDTNLVILVPRSAVERRMGGYKWWGPCRPEGGPGPSCVAYVFISLGSTTVCRLHTLTLSDRSQVTLQRERINLFSFCTLVQISCKISNRSTLARGPEEIFYGGLNPMSAALVSESKLQS